MAPSNNDNNNNNNNSSSSSSKNTAKKDTPKPPAVDMDLDRSGMLMSLLHQIPLIARTAVLHIFRYSEPSNYMDLWTEIIIVVLRNFLAPGRVTSITSAQRIFARDAQVKGQMWISKYACPTPTDCNVRDVLAGVVEGLRDGQEEEPQCKLKMPGVARVEAEWTGYRAGATKESMLPDMPEKDIYGEMMKEVSSPATILYFHGGAFWLMDPATHRATTSRLAKLSGGRCYSVRYRLAPQHTFPSALMDALVSYLALLYPPSDAFHSAVVPQHVVFAGDSAGGNLALSLLQTVLQLQRTNTPITWQGQTRTIPLPGGVAVNSPWMDITHSLPSCETNANFDYLPSLTSQINLEANRPHCAVWPATPPRHMIYATDELVLHPLVSLLLVQSWEGAPPLWICTGRELLADEDKFTAQKFWRDGVPVVYEEYEGMPHCFALIFERLPGARRCMEGWAGFAKRVAEGGKTENKFMVVRAKVLVEEEVDPEGLSRYTAEEIREMVVKRLKAGVVCGGAQEGEGEGMVVRFREVAKL